MNKNVSKKTQKYGKILEIGLNSTSQTKVLASVRQNLLIGSKFSIYTPNPEIVLYAQKDKKYAQILNSSAYCIPDGIGLALAYEFLKLPKVGIPFLDKILFFFQEMYLCLKVLINKGSVTKNLKLIKGRDLFMHLILLCNKMGWKVFFLGGEGDETELTARKLLLSFKNLKVEVFQGPMLDKMGNPLTLEDYKLEKEAIRRINDYDPKLLFVAFGAPKQEYWIDRNLVNLNIGGVMAVGGTFNYISGKMKLPPKFMEKMGLEWLWRLTLEPKRMKRMFNAVVIFLHKIYIYKLSNISYK